MTIYIVTFVSKNQTIGCCPNVVMHFVECVPKFWTNAPSVAKQPLICDKCIWCEWQLCKNLYFVLICTVCKCDTETYISVLFCYYSFLMLLFFCFLGQLTFCFTGQVFIASALLTKLVILLTPIIPSENFPHLECTIPHNCLGKTNPIWNINYRLYK